MFSQCSEVTVPLLEAQLMGSNRQGGSREQHWVQRQKLSEARGNRILSEERGTDSLLLRE